MDETLKLDAPLNKDAICSAIDELGRPLLEEVDVLQSIDSTNSYLLSKPINEGLARICVSEAQSEGRGRRGNDWQSSANQNILFSLAWGFPDWPETITGLGLAVATVVAERLNTDFFTNLNQPADADLKREPSRVEIKWPNDLMVAGNKLGGILVDVAGESRGACNVVIGLGLNVNQADLSDSETGYRWQDLRSLGVSLDRNQFIGRLASDLIAMLQSFERNGFAPLCSRWNQLSSYSEQEIVITSKAGQLKGQMQGVDKSGVLLLVDDSGAQHVIADSSVSVRLLKQ
jgi:BirA family biotin operon repressor/biotin-[acetyl-CoA-carboxylase] ligase